MLAEYRRLDQELSARHDVFFAYDDSRRRFDPTHPDTPRVPWRFTHDQLFDLGYPRKGRNRRFHPGNMDLVLLRFFRERPSFDFYWLIEHDVRFTGRWTTLVDDARPAEPDLVGTTLCTRQSAPDWRFWYTLDTPAGVDAHAHEMVRGFFPVLRLSRRALEILDAAYRRGWTGHCEGAVPTILHAHGLRLEDLGGDGPFVRAGNVNRFYTNTPADPLLSPGTFVFRPRRDRAGPIPDMLWHPVKGAGDRTWTFRAWRDHIDRWRARLEQRRFR